MVWGTGGMSHQLQGPRAGPHQPRVRHALPRPAHRRSRGPRQAAARRLRARGRVRGHRARDVADHARRARRRRARGLPLLPRAGVEHRASATSSSRIRDEPQATRRGEAMKVALAGAGAFGVKHLEAIAKIDGVEVVSLVGRTLDATREVAARFGIGHVTTELAESLARPDVDAVILCTPTQMHASQAIACLEAGKHVQVEIPLADSPGRRRGGRARAEGDRQGRDGRPHAPLQPEPPVGAQEDRRGRDRRSSRWTCRPTSSAARTSTRWASRARGPTTCCGTTPRTRSTCSPTRPAARSSPPTRCRGRSIPSSASRWTCRSS